jgi:DnaJ-class molecular chaperone
VLTPPVVIVPPAPPAAAPPPARASAAPVPTPASTVSAAGLDRAQLQELEQRAASLGQMDYFQLLKLQPSATPGEIKAAFYRESRTYHPDRFFQLADKAFKEKVGHVYKRLTEAYYVLRDDAKRKRYAADVASPERNAKLRFTDATEAETKQQVKKEQEEQIGVHPKARQFYATAMKDEASGNLAAAERNLKMALTFEPSNARYKEKLAEISKKVYEDSKKQGSAFKIK